MERKYIFWHHGWPFLLAIACSGIGCVAAVLILVVAGASTVGVIAACASAVLLLPIPWWVDLEISRARRRRQ